MPQTPATASHGIQGNATALTERLAFTRPASLPA
jgi:hypothetical protein